MPQTTHFASLAAAVILSACHPQHAAVEPERGTGRGIEPAAKQDTTPQGNGVAPAGLDPLRAPNGLAALSVSGHASAVVSVPLGTTRPRPVVVVAHGNFDRPEWECRTWRWIVGNRAFVLCPRGRPRADGPRGEYQRFTYDGGAALAREITAGLDALRTQYGAYVDPGAVVYAGFSLGAILGPEAIRRTGAPTVAAVMTEGSHPQWTDATIRAFRAAGGQRVLFACGSGWCDRASQSTARRLEARGIEARYTTAAGAGHDYNGRVAEHVAAEIDWLFGSDPRFERGLDLPAAAE